MENLAEILLDNLNEPVIFVDMDHTITYMNKSAKKRLQGGERLPGTSVFDYYNEKLNQQIIDIFEKMKFGLSGELIENNENHRLFVKCVNDNNNKMIGYFLRYEPPGKRR